MFKATEMNSLFDLPIVSHIIRMTYYRRMTNGLSIGTISLVFTSYQRFSSVKMIEDCLAADDAIVSFSIKFNANSKVLKFGIGIYKSQRSQKEKTAHVGKGVGFFKLDSHLQKYIHKFSKKLIEERINRKF